MSLFMEKASSIFGKKNIVWHKKSEQTVSKARINKNGSSEKLGLLQTLYFSFITNIVLTGSKDN